MDLDTSRKIIAADDLPALGESCRDAGATVVLCHGCFDIVHPGHLRYLRFARNQGDILVVSITGDDAIEKSDGTRPYVPQEHRAEALAAIEFVDHVVVAPDPTAEPTIAALRPDVYVKGKEYEHSVDPRFLAEKTQVETLGGRVIYSSGEVVYSSSALIESAHAAIASDAAGEQRRLAACCHRWGLDAVGLSHTISGSFVGKRVAVVGDALLDRYVFCDATNVAGEAPILSVRPLDEATYLGGAAIIAAHLKAMGATPHLVTTVGSDADSSELLDRLDDARIAHTAFDTRRSLPTKQRFMVDTQKLLKIDRTEEQPLDTATQRRLMGSLMEMRTDLDAIIFTDFGCGTITLALLAEAMPTLRPHIDVITGDVSGSRRSLLAMREADLLAPTERELRGAMGDFDESLPTVAVSLMRELHVGNLAVTMGRRGCVLLRPREDDPTEWFTAKRLRSEYLPSLAPHAVDPVGAGDAFLSAATLMMTTGSPLTHAGYLGSAAAAIAISRVGNLPVTREQLQSVITSRPELAGRSAVTAG